MAEFSRDSGFGNVFSLVRTLDQDHFDNWGTEPPVQPFTTGFKDATDTELRLYTHHKVKDLRRTGNRSGLTQYWIAKLDERSSHDSTVIMQYCMEREIWAQMLEDTEQEFCIPGQTDVTDDEIWWKWRVQFKDSFQLFNSVDEGDLDMMTLYTRPEYLDSDGVFHVDIPRKIIRGEITDPVIHGVS